MDLIRKMSSGLRSSQELSAAVEQSKKDDSVLPSAGSSDKDDGEVFEDATSPGPQAQQNSETGTDEGQRGGSSGKEQQEPSAGGSGIRAPAQMNDEYDAYDDDDNDAAGEEEEEEDEDIDEEDGGGSYGSGESYDSALEVAGSSDANYDSSSSPRISSPVGSFLPGPAVVGGEEGSVMNVSQQGALMRLNQLRTGESSLDNSVIDNSTPEDFSSIIEQLAEREGKSVEDPSFQSILDALLPLVTEKAEGRAEKAEGNDNEAKLKNGNEGNSEVSSGRGDSEVQGSQGSMPRAELSTNDEEDDLSSEKESDGEDSKPAPEENGVKERDSSQATIRAPLSEDEVSNDQRDSTISENTKEKSKDEGKDEAKDATVPPVAKQTGNEKPDEDAGGQSSPGTSLPREDVPSNREDGDENDDEEYEVDEDEDDYEGEGDDDEGDAEDQAAALEALVNAVDSAAAVAESEPTPRGGSAGPSLPARPTRPARSSLPSLDPAPRTAQTSRGVGGVATQPVDGGSQANGGEPADGNEETREKLQAIRVKFLRLALRLGQPAHNVVVAQVLYRLGLAEQLRGGRSSSRNSSFSFDRANAIAEDQEAAGPEELDFSCTIMMLGKTGVGKSATINSIFDEPRTGTNAYSPSTKKVQVITGQVHGIKVRVIDTPGLLPSVHDQRHNEKIMASVKSFIKKQSPDIVLYFDRLDMQSRDLGDLPLLRTITDTFGAAVWFNAIVVLTHASSAPPDGANGLPLSYEMFVAQRSHVVQQTIRQAAGDMRLMNPVSLVENHAACRVNRARERVLPNGQVWKPQLLLLCFASKILAEANSLLKLQDSTPGRPFGRSRVPPLPFLLSSLLQSRAQLKLPDEQLGDEDESDEDLESESDSDADEDYDQLPPFRRLSREEVAELDEDNRGKYFEELAERERLFQKKQWREELRRRREMKRRMAEAPMDQSQFADEALEEDMARSAAVPVPMPDMVLPPSFDSDNPSHRYRYLETANQWLVRPVLETHGWDHDNGYDGMSVEKMFILRQSIPASVSGQITKDKKEANLNMECAASLKHGEGKVTLAGLDLQTVGKDIGYTVRSETRFSNFKGNKTTGGLAVTLLGDTISAGMKIEDRLIVGKRVKLVLNGGAITGGGDVAYGGSLEATLRDKEYPLSRTLSTLGVSVMDWHGDLAIGGNLQSQFILGRTMMVGRANLNNRGAGQISIRASSSDQMQMTLIGLLPVIRSIVNRLLGSQPQQ